MSNNNQAVKSALDIYMARLAPLELTASLRFDPDQAVATLYDYTAGLPFGFLMFTTKGRFKSFESDFSYKTLSSLFNQKIRVHASGEFLETPSEFLALIDSFNRIKVEHPAAELKYVPKALRLFSDNSNATDDQASFKCSFEECVLLLTVTEGDYPLAAQMVYADLKLTADDISDFIGTSPSLLMSLLLKR
jgi:hypothetical protein